MKTPFMFAKNIFIVIVFFGLFGCVAERAQHTADGQLIPGRQLMDFRKYEHICEPLLTKNLKEIEEILNQYGRNGWQMGGFITRDGNTIAYCVMR